MIVDFGFFDSKDTEHNPNEVCVCINTEMELMEWGLMVNCHSTVDHLTMAFS